MHADDLRPALDAGRDGGSGAPDSGLHFVVGGCGLGWGCGFWVRGGVGGGGTCRFASWMGVLAVGLKGFLGAG